MKSRTKKGDKFPRRIVGVFVALAFLFISFALLFAFYPRSQPKHPSALAPHTATTSLPVAHKTKPVPPKPAAPSLPATHPAGPYADAREDILVKINQVRAAAGIAPLTRNLELDASAQAKADAETQLDFFAHDDPDGSPPWHYITGAGYRYTYAGENLSEDFDADAAFDAWMNSPTHRANILNPHYQETGIAIEGRYIVEHFASPSI